MIQADAFPEIKLTPEEEPNERYTPWGFFSELHREFNFTLDACATAESAKCERFLTKADDGLKAWWHGERVWCNPPFDDIETWVRKAWGEQGAELVVMLVPAWTDRDWWAELIERNRDGRSTYDRWVLTTRFLRGRVRFGFPGNPDGIGVESPPFWCCLLIWRAP